MKIRKLQLKNIGVFDDETIEFKECPVKDKAEIHILTGENGSGKTTILMALASSFFLTLFRGDDISGILNLSESFKKRIRNNTSAQLNISLFESNQTKDYFYSISENQLQFSQSPVEFSYKNTIDQKLMSYSEAIQIQLHKYNFSFAALAYSGYRRIKDESINLFDEIEENPLFRALDFIKDENSKFTVNQWLGRNLSKRALANEENDNEAKRFDENIKNLEKVVAEVIGYKIKFKLKTDLSLVLIKDSQELDFDVLPDGLKSLISWIGDLLMRLDSLKWENDTLIFEREIILFLDEIEVHLHPAWQRKVLPVVQKLFKNSQIFVSTHSPFIVNSVDDAWVYKLELENGRAKVAEPIRTENSNSITQVLREIFDIYGLFGKDVQDNLDKLENLRDMIRSNGSSQKDEKEFLKIAKKLYDEPSDQVKNIVKGELQQLSEINGKKFSI